MELGLFLDLRNPPGWRQDPARLYDFTLEICEEAERLGLHSVWVTEHHMFEDGYCPQPLTFLAAAAARTRRIRLGTAIMLGALRPAPGIAEESAMVDILSNGRLEIGLGAGYRIPEFRLFGADFAGRFRANDQRARDLRALWQEGRLSPAPVQARVPIWMGYQTPKGARRAGLLGERLLCPNGALWDAYREGLVEAGHDPAIGWMGGHIQGWISEDAEADWPVVAPYLRYQLESYKRYGLEETGIAPPPIDLEKLRGAPLAAGMGAFLLAGPAEAAARITQFTAGAPVRHVHLWASIAGMPERLVVRHVQLLAQGLAPLLRQVGR